MMTYKDKEQKREDTAGSRSTEFGCLGAAMVFDLNQA
jgi:hypothetical protein